MERARKKEIVAELRRTLEGADAVVVTRHNGLTVAEATELRRAMRAVDARFRVTKNGLALRALEGTSREGLRDLFAGPTAIATSDDAVSVAKAAVDYARKNEKLVVLGAAMGARPLDAAQVAALAALPSLDRLRAGLVAVLQAPATKVAGVLQAPAGQVARVLGAHARAAADA